MSTAPTHFVKDYTEHVARLKSKHESDDALRAAVGGEFVAMGKLERALLEQFGLGPNPSLVIDVGCGSGRLAAQPAPLRNVTYLGTEIIPELLSFARRLSDRADWRFEHTDGTKIPAADACADFVCFFSVFTHLLHHESYRYLADAGRVAKPGGIIVFSFLEFRIDCHWSIFEALVNNASANPHLDQFMSRDAIEAWAQHLGLEVLGIYDGHIPHIPLSEPVTHDNGVVMRDKGNLGQSVAVLRRPA